MGKHHGIQQALVIEHENRRAPLLQVFGTLDIKLQPGKAAAEIAQQLGDAIGIGKAWQPQALADRADHRRRRYRLSGQCRAQQGFDIRQAPAGETELGPALVAGVGAETVGGVHRHRVPHQFQQRQVGAGIGIEPALVQPGVVAPGNPSRRQGLALAVAHGADHLAGETSLEHFQPGAADFLYTQQTGDGFHLVVAGRGDDHQFVAGGPVRLHQADGFPVQAPCEVPLAGQFTQLPQAVLGDARQRPAQAPHQLVVVAATFPLALPQRIPEHFQ